MSYINDALRKAQQEKDSHYQSYGKIISHLPDRPTRSRRKWILACALVLASALTAAILWVALYAQPDRAADLQARQSARPQGTAVQIPSVPVQESAVIPLPAPVAEQEKPSGKGYFTDAATLYEEALSAQRQKQIERAERLYKRVLSIDPGHVNALNNLGVLYMSQHRQGQAIPLFEKALSQKRDYADPYYNLACLYAQRGETGQALAHLKSAVAINGEVVQWAKQDGDLKSIRSTEAFKSIMEKKSN